MVKRTDSLGHALHYHYDGERNLVGLTNEKGERYRLGYDLNERLIEEVGFDGRRQRYEYNAVGHLIASEEYRAGDNTCLNRIRYQRDAQARLLEQWLEISQGQAIKAPLKQFAYDPAGRLVTASNAHSKLTWQYDKAGRLTHIGQNGQVIVHDHDAIGRRTQSALPNGDKIQYAWDNSGQNQSIHFNGQTVVDFSRDAMGREVGRQYGNQLYTRSAYDPQGRLQEQRLINAGALVNQRQYHYNQAGQLSQIDDQRRGSTQYFYDSIDRLIAVNGPQPERFVHDPAGNLLSVSDASQASATPSRSEQNGQVQYNRLNFFGDQHYSYDSQGNRIQTLRGKDHKLVTLYRYDALNQLTEVEHNGTTTQYEYDPLGRRIAKRSAHKTTTFLWNDDVLLSETQTSHIARQQGKQIEHKTYLFEPDSFTPVAFVQDNAIFHYHTDHLGTPQDITNAKGNIVWSANYRAYGNLALANVEEVENNLRFQGQYYDEESGLHYNRFRYYDPNCGRFINQDPIGLEGGTNNYQYVPNPISWIDPLGLTCEDCGGSNDVPERGSHNEVYANKPVKPENATDKWEEFLGEGPYSNTHPRTGEVDPNRLVSADGKRSIRYGDHEMNSKPTKHHYHEETWTHDTVNNVMNVDNTVVRVPLPKK